MRARQVLCAQNWSFIKNDGAEKADNERIPEVKTSIAVSVKSVGTGNPLAIAGAKITQK